MYIVGNIKVEPVAGEADRWFVWSGSRDWVVHIVDMDWEGGTGCSCEHFMVRGVECKHIRLIKRILDGGNVQ